MPESRTTILRDATFDDYTEAGALLVRLGLVMPEGEAALKTYFRQLWEANPVFQAAAALTSKPLPLGWVLEDGGRMVGFFGNVPLLYSFAGEPVIVSDASLWGVEKAYRGETARLSDAYFQQDMADLLMVTTAIKPTARIFERYGAARLPQPDFDKVLFWVIDGAGFARAGLRKKGAGSVSAWFGGTLSGAALNAYLRLFGRRPFAPLDHITIEQVDEIDGSFDDLWKRKTGEYPNRLMACRNAAALRWHFSTGRNVKQTRIITYRASGRLEGYAAVIRDDAPDIGLRRLKIADLFVAGDVPAVTGALLTAAYEYGLARGCHVLEAIGLPGHLRRQLERHKPQVRNMPTYPFYYKALKPQLAAQLDNDETWYASAFDGDTTLL